MELTFTAELVPWQASPNYVFVALPEDAADAIDDAVPRTGGFGSVKVKVSLGGTQWSTSLFPSRELKTYVLPVKKAVRVAEKVDIGDVVSFTIEIVGI